MAVGYLSAATLRGDRLAQDEEDVVGEAAAGVIEEQGDDAAQRGIEPGRHEGRRHPRVEIEEPALMVTALDEAVGVEEKPVSRLQRDVLPGRMGMQAERWDGALRRHELPLR